MERSGLFWTFRSKQRRAGIAVQGGLDHSRLGVLALTGVTEIFTNAVRKF